MNNPSFDFARSSSLLLARYESARLDVSNARERTRRQIDSRKTDRIHCKQAHVKRLLPNADRSTFTRLAGEFPGFMNRSIDTHVERFRSLRIPFMTQLFGGASTYREKAERELLDLIGPRLSAYLDSLEPFSDIVAIDNVLDELNRKEAGLIEQENLLRKQIATLSFAKRSGAPVPKAYAKAVERAAASQGSVVDDNSNVVMIMLLEQSLLDTMFSYDHSGEVSSYQAEVFTPGGGSFGSAGATSSWDSPTELMASHDHTDGSVTDTSPQPATFDDASVAGLGAIS